jgi:hypothetical protein
MYSLGRVLVGQYSFVCDGGPVANLAKCEGAAELSDTQLASHDSNVFSQSID